MCSSDLEYAVVGAGTPVVVLHGSPGGIDAAALMAGFLPRDRISAILLSRPGYLGTELGNRATIDQQADLLAALLDHLRIGRTGVLSWSGGGPAGYRLAVRHPDRVDAIVAFAAVSRVGCHNVGMVLGQWFQAAVSYSLMSPPRIGRRRILP